MLLQGHTQQRDGVVNLEQQQGRGEQRRATAHPCQHTLHHWSYEPNNP